MISVIGTIAIVIVFVAIGIVLDRKIGLWPRPGAVVAKPAAPRYVVGEAPSVAIRAGEAQLAKLRDAQRCPACRKAMTNERDDTVRYNDRELLVLQFRCASCQTKRSLYVDAA